MNTKRGLMVILFMIFFLSIGIVQNRITLKEGEPDEERFIRRASSFHSEIEANTLTALRESISYQIHSVNDLRAWHQNLKKGMKWIKIDPHYMIPPFCMKQASVSDPSRGCLLLSHDEPIDTVNYYTLDSILEYMTNPQHIDYFKSPETFYVALCFKGTMKPCSSNTNATNWVSLVDNFYNKATKVVQDHSLNVEFILDGAGTHGGNRTCLANKWKPWVSTWVSYRDPSKALYVDNTTLGYERFQIMNEHVPGGNNATFFINRMAEANYGKFKNSKYPFLMWEPSDQSEITDAGTVYVQKGIPHNPGFRFSTNNDISQLQIFSGNLNWKAWNLRLSDLEQKSHGHIIALSPFTYQGTEGYAFLLVYKNDKTGNYYQFFFSTSPPNQSGKVLSDDSKLKPISVPKTIPWFYSLSLAPQIDSVSVVDLSTNSIVKNKHLAVIASKNLFALFHVDLETFELTPKVTSVSEVSGTTPTGRSSVHLEVIKDEIVLVQTFPSLSCHIELRIWSLGKIDSVQSRMSPRLVSMTCVSTQTKVEDVSVTFFPSDNNNQNNMEGFLLYSSTGDSSLFAVHFSASTRGGVLSITNNQGAIVTHPSLLGVATKHHLSSLLWGNTRMILLVADGSFCTFSLQHNVEAVPKVCDVPLESTNTILSYTLGTMEEWREIIVQSRGPITSCSDTLLHGTYDRGYAPVASLFLDKSKENIQLVTIHDGIKQNILTMLDYGGCGRAMPFDGLVVDSWPIPYYKRNLPDISTTSGADAGSETHDSKKKTVLLTILGLVISGLTVCGIVFAVIKYKKRRSRYNLLEPNEIMMDEEEFEAFQ